MVSQPRIARTGTLNDGLKSRPGLINRLAEFDAEATLGDQEFGNCGGPLPCVDRADREGIGQWVVGKKRLALQIARGLKLQQGLVDHPE